MTFRDWLTDAQQKLEASGCPDPHVDAAWLLEDMLGISTAQVRRYPDRIFTAEEEDLLARALSRRIAGEPLQYITGRADFMGLRFHVDPRVLIPRADTENLVEQALYLLKNTNKPHPAVLDLCTGSGAIGISIAKMFPKADVTLTDISPDALDIARMNAEINGVNVRFAQGDLFEAIGETKFDLVVSNPPYIPRADLAGLQREVQAEPKLALDGGESGLDFYRRIAREARFYLNPEGAVALEVGEGQARDVVALLEIGLGLPIELHSPVYAGQTAPFNYKSGIILDLNGVERVVWARS